MKRNIFFVDEAILIQYLEKYGKSNTKDYEFAISIHAKKYFEEKLNQKLIIVFEQNNKLHNYPKRFTPNLGQLREIITTYNEENTPVDFGLAPVNSGEFDGFAYPFQVKKFITKPSETTNDELAAYINKKANRYRSSDIGLIIVPQLVDLETDTKGFDKQELISKLNINDNAVRVVYMFQFFNKVPKFILLWASPQALAEIV